MERKTNSMQMKKTKHILHANSKVAWEINKKKRYVHFPTDQERFWSTYIQ